MATDFTKAMDAEIAELECELAADPRYIKLQEIRRVRKLYAESGQYVTGSRGISTLIARSASRRRASERNQEILDLAVSIIKGRTDPTPTAEIYKAVIEKGMSVHGQKPQNTLSAMLSNAQQFIAHGRSGWTLAEQDRNAEAVDDKSSEGNSSTASNPIRHDQSENPTVRPVDPVSGGGT